jgi:outer membrane biosynthesis protein TonB
VKSPGENKGAKEGTEKKGALEKPKPVPEEGLKSQPETKLAMLTPPPVPKTVPMPKPEPPQTETPPAKPELSLQQPPPAPPSPPPSPPGGTGSAGSVSEREIAARKTKLNTTGVTRLGIAAFNVEESPFGAYDKQIVRAVQSRWYALIEKNGLYERAGEVTIHFQLLADGTVTNAEVKSTSAGEILALFCQKAIVESAPFAPWPEQLRAYLGNEPRDVDFTFYY